MARPTAARPPVRFQTHPSATATGSSRRRRRRDADDGRRPHGGERDGYELKLNSYDIGVDVELADAVQRIRFEHPEVRCVVLTGALDRVFCAGANIVMLRTSTHAFKVNFCKFTNETRLSIEDASALSGIRSSPR
jgi:benzoyl-CoA-dihydrodiol lyase